MAPGEQRLWLVDVSTEERQKPPSWVLFYKGFKGRTSACLVGTEHGYPPPDPMSVHPRSLCRLRAEWLERDDVKGSIGYRLEGLNSREEVEAAMRLEFQVDHESKWYTSILSLTVQSLTLL